MRTYWFLIEDDRYSVPTLQFVTARDEGAARRIAHTRLADSPHHKRVEVLEDDRFLFRLDLASGGGERRVSD